MSLKRVGRGSGKLMGALCGCDGRTAWQKSGICHKSFESVTMQTTGRSMPVVHLLWEQTDRVQFSAARLSVAKEGWSAKRSAEN